MEACNVDLGLRLSREAGQSVVCLAVLSSSLTRLTMVRWADHAFTRATNNLWSRSGRQSELGKKERMILWQFRTGVAPSGDHE